jgi:hypothetical protein
MSIVEPDRPSTRKFLSVVCPCGRGLRAPTDLAGQEISCWECQRKVRVPVPHSPERAFRVIHDALPEVFEIRWLALLFLGAVALTGVLCVPDIGIPLGTLVLILGALAYGELIRQCGVDFWDFDDWKQPGQLAARVGVAIVFGVCMAAPMLLGRGGLGTAPRFSTLGFLLGLVASAVLPLAMFVTYARDNDGPMGWRRAGGMLWRNPLATFLALLLFPLGVMVAELVLIVATSYQGMFPFLVLDLFPDSDYFAAQYKIPKFGNYTKFELPETRFYQLYLRRLHHGFTLTSALPASLSRKTDVLASPWTLELVDSGYLMIRAIYTQVAMMILLVFLAVQARWLGAISILESKRSLEIDL